MNILNSEALNLEINSEIAIYTFENQPFRVVGCFENPRFIVKDICNILEISNPTNAVRNIPEEWIGDLYQIKDANGRPQNMRTVYEPGVYYFIMRSDKEIAKRFQKWVCGEVLTSIRKKGEYILQEYKAKLETQQKLLEEKEAETKQQQQLISSQQTQIKKLENKVLIKQKRSEHKDKINVIYLIQDEFHKRDRIYVIGRAVNLADRLGGYNKSRDHEVAYYKPCKSRDHMNLVELMVLYKLDKYREQANRDRFILPEDKDLSLFTKVVDDAVKWFEDIDEKVSIKNENEEASKEEYKEYMQEYFDEHREEIKDQKKEHYEEHKEEILEKCKEYRQKNPEKVKSYRQQRQESGARKAYNDTHKEQISRYNKKQYYKDQSKSIERVRNYRVKKGDEVRAKSNERNRRKVMCECGIEVCYGHKSRHVKSKQHIDNMKQLEILNNATVPTVPTVPTEIETQVIAYDIPSLIVNCECGSKINKNNMSKHVKSQKHQNYLQSLTT